MKVSDLLQSRRKDWSELEMLCIEFESKANTRRQPERLTRFAALYRSLCADLALAEAYQLPPEVTRYLHRLVGRAHNQLYRSREFTVSTWARTLLYEVPQQLFNDGYLRLAFCIFWGAFLLSAILATTQPGFAEAVVGAEQLETMEEMYKRPLSELPQKIEEGMTVISAVGQLDAFTASDLKAELRKLMNDHHTKLILDFQNVERVNSTAVGIILTVAKQLREQEGDLRAFGMSIEVRKVFNLLGASKILRIFGTKQETLSSFM